MDEITYSGLKSMNKTDYNKLFKKPAEWRKATAVLFLAKYKFSNGRLPLVAIPFKKYNDASKCFKEEVKKDKEIPYMPKLALLASIEVVKNSSGVLTAQITPMKGGMNNDYLEAEGKELFAALSMNFNVIGDQVLDKEDLIEVAAAAGEDLNSEDAAKELAKKKAYLERINSILKNLPKLDAAIGKVDANTLKEKLAVYEQALEEIKENSQGQYSTPETIADFQRISSAIESIKEKIKALPKKGESDNDNIASDAILDNLDNADIDDQKTESEAAELEDITDNSKNLNLPNLKRVKRCQNELTKLKSKIIEGDIDPDIAMKELNLLQSDISAGLGLTLNENDSMEEITPIMDKMYKDILQLQKYVDQKLRPLLEQRGALKEEVEVVLNETGKTPAVLINDLKETTLKEMESKFSTYELNLNKYYKN